MFQPVVVPVQGEVPSEALLLSLSEIHSARGDGKVIVVAWNSNSQKGCAAVQKTLELTSEKDVKYLKFNIKNGFLHFQGTRRKLA